MGELGPNINNNPLIPSSKLLDDMVGVQDLQPIAQAIAGTQASIDAIWNLLESYGRFTITDADGLRYEVMAKPVGITDPGEGGPLTLYRQTGGEIGVRWGIVNSLVPENIDDEWGSTAQKTYFFIEADLSNPKARLVTGSRIVTGSTPNSYATQNFTNGNPPSAAYFPLGYADDNEVVNAGRGNLEYHVITSHVYTESGDLKVEYRIAIYRTG